MEWSTKYVRTWSPWLLGNNGSRSCRAPAHRLRLSDKLFSGLFCSLLEVLAGLDDDRRISVLNLHVVHLPKSLPGATINDFWKLCFHCFLTVVKNVVGLFSINSN